MPAVYNPAVAQSTVAPANAATAATVATVVAANADQITDTSRPLTALAARILGRPVVPVTGRMAAPSARSAKSSPSPLQRLGGSLFAGVTMLALIITVATPADAGPMPIGPALSLKAPAPLEQIEQIRKRPDLPRGCAIEIGSRSGRYIALGESCLRRAGFRGPLPRHCAGPAYRNSGRTFAVSCLERAGFRIEGNRGHGKKFDHGHRHPRDNWGDDRRDHRYDGHRPQPGLPYPHPRG